MTQRSEEHEAKLRLVGRVLWLVVASAVLAMLPALILTATSSELRWQHVAFALAFAGLAATAFATRRRLTTIGAERALHIALRAMLLVSTIICLLIRVPQALVAATFAFIVLVSAPRILSRAATDRWVTIAILAGLGLSLSDFIPIPFRIEADPAILQPLELTIATAVAAFGALSLRELRHFPIQTKIYLTALLLAVVPMSLVITAFRSGIQEHDATVEAHTVERRAALFANAIDGFLGRELLLLADLSVTPEVADACRAPESVEPPAEEAKRPGEGTRARGEDRGKTRGKARGKTQGKTQGKTRTGAHKADKEPAEPAEGDEEALKGRVRAARELLERSVAEATLRRSLVLLPRPGEGEAIAAGEPLLDVHAGASNVTVHTVDPALGSQILLSRTTSGGCTLVLGLQPGLLRTWTRLAAIVTGDVVVLRDTDDLSLSAAGDEHLLAELGADDHLPAVESLLGSGDLPRPLTTTLLRDRPQEGSNLAIAVMPNSGWSLILLPHGETTSTALLAIRRALLLALLVAGLATLSAFYLGRHLGRPLHQLNEGLALFTAGAIETRVEVDSEDEVADLASSFNAMATQVGSLLHSLEEQARRLRDEVAERTEQEVHLQALNEELSDARDQAMAANRAKSAFLAGMSHELRTPLNAIIGYSELLYEDASDGGHESMAADALAVSNSAKHLLALINDILDLSRIESGRMRLKIEEFDVGEMLRDVLTAAQPLADRQGNTLRMHMDREPVMMTSDQTKIRQCILNLVSNAAKFTEQGTIDVRMRHEKLGVLPCLTFEVADSGIGLEQEALTDLFRAFSQVDSELARKHTGTGLGLTITRRLARKLGGEIQVASEVGVGTTFTIRVPQHYQSAGDSMTWGQSVASAIERSSASLQIPMK